MIDFIRRSYKKELLDRTDIPFSDICKNMQELNFINSTLGGHKITIKGFKQLLGNNKQLTLCEIGCGGGNNLFAIKKWAVKRNINVHYMGIDINDSCISYARTNAQADDIEFITSDYKSLAFEDKPDIIFCSLFTHHFAEKELTEMMKWMEQNASIGFFINDLHRHRLAYFLILLLTRLFSKSYLVKNDAPLSVLRGFKKTEWKSILQSAGIMKYSIHWQWAFRHLIIVERMAS